MESKHKYIFTTLGIVGVFFVFYIFCTKEVPPPETVASPSQKRTYFSTIPVRMSSANLPCISAIIDGESFSVVLDLGLRGEFSLPRKHLERISHKKLVGTDRIYSFMGNNYLVPFYKVPRASIQAASWREPVIGERCDEYAREIRIIHDKDDPVDEYDGAMGWLLFREMNLLLDFGNGKAVICDGLGTLRKRGYLVDSWVRTPLLIDRGIVECEATTPDGIIRCFLDTGTTCNFLHKEMPGKSMADACLDHNNFVEYSSFKVGETELGPIVLRQVPVRLPISVPVVLGMDFFLNHQVFIDFVEGYLYFSPPSEHIRPTPNSSHTAAIPVKKNS